MGNAGSNRSNSRSRHGGESSTEDNHHTYDDHRQHPEPQLTNQYIYAAAYTSEHPDHDPYLQYQTGARYPPPPPLPTVPFRSPRDDPDSELFEDRNFSCTYIVELPTTYVDHQKAVTITYDVNLKKETLKIEADEENPGKFLVSFTFDATVPCSITLHFFAKEGEDCNLTTSKEHSLPPITVRFQQGLGQKFRQICKGNSTGVYRLAVMAEARKEDRNLDSGVSTSQMTDAVFEDDKGEYKVKAVKQILWVNGIKYELQEIYGIGNSVDGGDYDGNDAGKECVVCLSEPRDTTVLPCRHMCMCNGCAKVLRSQTNRCPICRKTVEMLLEIKFISGAEDRGSYFMPHH